MINLSDFKQYSKENINLQSLHNGLFHTKVQLDNKIFFRFYLNIRIPFNHTFILNNCIKNKG